MKKLHAVAGVLFLASQAALADLGYTLTWVSDYDFRGISLSAGDPAVQGSIDYSSGLFYSSVWASQIDSGPGIDGDLEVDLVAGLAGETEGGLRWDVGGTYYLYPGSNEDLGDLADPDDDILETADYAEIYAGGGVGPFDAKLWYSPDLYESDETAWYAEVGFNASLPADFGLTVHAGYNFGDYYDDLYNPYTDFSIGVTRSIGEFDFELKGVAASTDSAFNVATGPFRNDNRVILLVSTTFPWGDDE